MTANMLLQTIVLFTIMLGVLIFVHELGHFMVAKRMGVGVLKFSLGFGRRLFGFRRGETEYLVSAIPLGGYVKMMGEDPREVVIDDTGQVFDGSGQPLDLEKSFAHKSVWARVAIVLAGPGSNFLLALLLFWGVFAVVGRPVFPSVAGKPEPQSAAAVAGIQTGDRILAVMDRPVKSWEDIAASTDATAGTYSWTVTGPASPSCLVRVSHAADGVPADASVAAFSIAGLAPPSITSAAVTTGQVDVG